MTATNKSATTAPSDPSQFIDIRGLVKTYGSPAAAVDHLDLTIERGQFVVLLGPSGCGKTTTMRSLVGLERPDEGVITVDGRVLFDARRGIDVPSNKRHMGMVFQSYALWPHKSVMGNVAFPLQMQRKPRGEIKQRVAEALRIVGLDGFESRKITTLSGGQMQRVALARSLVMDPTILLLDEPLSNLDARLRVHLRAELKEIQQRIGVTTIYVTHDQDEALGLADRIIVLRNGRIAQDATPEDLYRRPASPFVADFLGMSNQFTADLQGSADGVATVRLDSGAVLQTTDLRTDGAARARVCFRPEAAMIGGAGDGVPADGANRLPATAISRQFQGSRLRYHVAIGDGVTIFAEASAEAPRYDPDEGCAVEIATRDVLLLDDREPTSVPAAGDDRAH